MNLLNKWHTCPSWLLTFQYFLKLHSCSVLTLILWAGATVVKVDASWLLGCQVSPEIRDWPIFGNSKACPPIVPYFGHSREFLPTSLQHHRPPLIVKAESVLELPTWALTSVCRSTHCCMQCKVVWMCFACSFAYMYLTAHETYLLTSLCLFSRVCDFF